MLNLDQIKKSLAEISPKRNPWEVPLHFDANENAMVFTNPPDATFIAQAPTIISELVKEIEELRKENFAQKGKLIEASLCLTMNRPSEEYLDWVETAMPENVRGTLVQQQMNIDDCLQKLNCTSNPKEGR